MRDTFCGTPLFLSPEMLKGENYCGKIDNWAIGMICYEMIVGKPAFKIQTQKELEKIVICGLFSWWNRYSSRSIVVSRIWQRSSF